MIDFVPITKASPVYNQTLVDLGIHSIDYRYDYQDLSAQLKSFARVKDEYNYLKLMREYGRKDFFFFAYFILNYRINHPFLIARAYDLQDEPTMTVDLWGREHLKSHLITCAKSIFDLVQDQDKTICVFSYERSKAVDHILKIRQALENNEVLKNAFPDVFFQNPSKESKWTEQQLFVKRKSTT